MQINVIGCLYVLDSEKNENIRKNDIKSLKVLTSNDGELPSISFNGGDIKKELKDYLYSLIGSKIFHLEQVYTMSYDKSVDVIYLAVTNIENIKKLSNNYELRDFKIEDNELITFGEDIYKYRTKEIEENNNIEFIHEIDVKDKSIERNLLNLIISYKKIRSNIDYTDILFKFMGSSFTLEDVRLVYELIKDKGVDKSNFRKKIIKYCEKIESDEKVKNGFRPSQKYRFKPLKGDIWI